MEVSTSRQLLFTFFYILCFYSFRSKVALSVTSSSVELQEIKTHTKRHLSPTWSKWLHHVCQIALWLLLSKNDCNRPCQRWKRGANSWRQASQKERWRSFLKLSSQTSETLSNWSTWMATDTSPKRNWRIQWRILATPSLHKRSEWVRNPFIYISGNVRMKSQV